MPSNLSTQHTTYEYPQEINILGSNDFCVFILDMDGVLSEIQDNAHTAVVKSDTRNALEKLSRLPNTSVNISTGRDLLSAAFLLTGDTAPLSEELHTHEEAARDRLEELTNKDLYLIAGHGTQPLEIIQQENCLDTILTESEKRKRDTLLHDLKEIQEALPFSIPIENKHTSIVVNYRYHDTKRKLSSQDKQYVDQLLSPIKKKTAEQQILVRENFMNQEFMIRTASKADAVTIIFDRLKKSGQKVSHIVTAGDDHTDSHTIQGVNAYLASQERKISFTSIQVLNPELPEEEVDIGAQIKIPFNQMLPLLLQYEQKLSSI